MKNLVSQIVEQCPKLIEYKNTTFGADKAEFENLLKHIDEDFYLVVDGLDHVSREYELHKDFISRSETEIISELLEIHFPDNCYVLIASQPIDELRDFKDDRYCVFEIEPWGVEQAKSLMETFQITPARRSNTSRPASSPYFPSTPDCRPPRPAP